MANLRVRRAWKDTRATFEPKGSIPRTLLTIVLLWFLGFREVAMEEVALLLAGGLFVSYLLWPGMVFAWNYTRTPGRLASDELTVLFRHTTAAYEAANELMDLMVADLRTMRAQDAMLYVAKGLIADLADGTLRPVLHRAHSSALRVLNSRERLMLRRDLTRRQQALSDFRSAYEALRNYIERIGKVMGPDAPTDQSARLPFYTARAIWSHADRSLQDFSVQHPLNSRISGERLE